MILAVCVSAHADESPPNILIITCDNLGYGDLQMYRPESPIRTPNLDKLAAQGARLTNYYTASPTCTVSRACLLTGRIPQRHGLVNQLGGVAGNYGVGLSHDEILLPQILKKAPLPYATGCFGKWNIGFAEGSRPTERGFDEFIGHASGNIDHYHHHYHDKHDLYQGTEELNREGDYATDIFADAAIDFIQRKSGKENPWFVYLPFNAPHFPSKANKRPGQPNIYQAPDWAFEEIGLSPDETDAKKRYDAVVYALDKAIGRVLLALNEAKVADDTFVFFMSDNGGFRLNRKGLDVGINEPLRSGGVTCWEGGIRVPALARWPGNIEAGSVIDAAFWSPDLLVTSAAMAGADLPRDRTYDGKDVRALLSEGGDSPHDSFYFEFRNHAALRKDDWKIVREKETAPWQLFDLGNDIAESNDLASGQAEKLTELAKEFERWREGWK
jgi:arylsulfatase A-like enzyme